MIIYVGSWRGGGRRAWQRRPSATIDRAATAHFLRQGSVLRLVASAASGAPTQAAPARVYSLPGMEGSQGRQHK